MEATHWGDAMVAEIKELERALRACKAGKNIEDDPSELKAEIARLKRLLD